MPSHYSELGFEFIDAVLWRFRACLSEVSIEHIPFVPLDPASRLEHPKKIVKKRRWVVVLDDTHEMADMDDVVFTEKLFWRRPKSIDGAQSDLPTTAST